jgi:hypothetical protein
VDFRNFIKERKLDQFVKNVFIFANDRESKKDLLPFFADGDPGIIFLDSANGGFLNPGGKKLTTFFYTDKLSNR